MRTAKWLGALALILAAYPFVANADDKAGKKDKFDATKLVGTWDYVSGEKKGEKVDKASFAGSKVVITKEKITLEGPAGKFIMEYTLDTAKSPVGISMKMTESPFGAGATAKGIIELKDDDMKFCYASAGDAPTKFESKAGTEVNLFVLKRAKEKAK